MKSREIKYTNNQKNQIIFSARNGIIAASNNTMNVLENSDYWRDLRSIPNPNPIGTQDIYLATLNKDTLLYITPY